MENNKKIPLTLVRQEIFKRLFEYELMRSDIMEDAMEYLSLNKEIYNKSKEEFFKNYLIAYIENEDKVVELVKENLEGWTFERLGVVEKVILKMAFYEINFKGEAHEIAINEALQLAKIFGDEKTSKFINGILACLVKGK